MSHEERDQKATHETHIGEVKGPVHTGSGNINVNNLSYAIPERKKDFLSGLDSLIAQLEEASPETLDKDAMEDVVIELRAAESEAKKSKPKAKRVLGRLEKAKQILEVAARTATTVVAVSQFMQAVDYLISVATKLF